MTIQLLYFKFKLYENSVISNDYKYKNRNNK